MRTVVSPHVCADMGCQSPALEVPLFAGVDLTLVSEITRDMCRVYLRGENLTEQGDPADHIFVVLRGNVCIMADGQTLGTRGVHDVIGEQAFIERTVRGATVQAVTQVQALRIPNALVDKLVTDPAFARNLLAAISRKLSQATRDRAIRYQQEELLMGEFRAHVSDNVAQRLLATGEDYGAPRNVPAVILFSDIRNFTELSSGMDPSIVADQLTTYFDSVVGVVHRHGGMIDKFIGDAVMAVWGFEECPADAMVHAAFQCAVDMIDVVRELMFGGKPIQVGVGLHYGPTFMGNIGGPRKRQFTVLGTTVNMASRYEAQTKVLKVPLVMGEAFAAQLPLHLRESLTRHAAIDIKGSSPQTLFTFTPAELAYEARTV